MIRMDQAIAFNNYQGRMIYIRRNHVGAFQIYHRGQGGDIQERLIQMDGEGGEVIRRKNQVIHIFPKKRSVIVEKLSSRSRPKGPLASKVPRYNPSMASSYRLFLTGTERIAGRKTMRIQIKPKDFYRYGYHLWLDEKTALPLKSQLIDSKRSSPIEELRFTSIILGDSISNDNLTGDLESSDYSWINSSSSKIIGRSAPAEINWLVADLPPGFVITGAHLEYINSSKDPRMHLVYSDSIASVSVFVDIGVAASEQIQGLSKMGAANAYSLMLDGWLVTAMGEVPAETVKKIAVSVRRKDRS
ncbi:MAG: MucB/RseB C-terminal domain-containing protein [Pseudomonadota bacterium]|nr:MucB/RseB C-terminal domain-containing protein [Pseudomonadota bacterium]